MKDLKLTMQLAGVLKEERKGVEAKEAEVSMRAINRGDALPGFSWKNVELTEGINSSFLEGNGAECLVTERFLKRNNLTEGERIRLLIRYPKLDDLGKVEWIDGGQEQFQIVGVIKDGEETGEWQELPDVVVPFGWAESTRDAWKADSASFILNLEDAEDINRFKEEMKEIPLHEIQPVGENNVEGNALVVRDESFLDSAARLKRQVRMLQWFRPVIAAVTLLAGYVAAWASGTEPAKGILADAPGRGKGRKLLPAVLPGAFLFSPGRFGTGRYRFGRSGNTASGDNRGILEERRAVLTLLSFRNGSGPAFVGAQIRNGISM